MRKKKTLAQQAADLLNGMGSPEDMRQAFAAMGYKAAIRKWAELLSGDKYEPDDGRARKPARRKAG